MARRAVRLASWTSMALAASGFYLYSNKYLDPNDFGAIRVGRAVATTAVISYDYLTSLRSVPYGSEEYLQLRSKVRMWDSSEPQQECVNLEVATKPASFLCACRGGQGAVWWDQRLELVKKRRTNSSL
ncbi:putative aarF domain-containing protein kinase 1, partial [Galemys pyrenaicus]